MLFLFLFLAGATVGFLSGLLGIGGGIIMFPALLYLPPLMGLDAIDVKSITGLTMIQGFFASLSAMFFYRKHGFVHVPLVLTLGLSLFLSSLAGAVYSKWLSDNSIMFIFGVMALFASAMMLIPRSYESDEKREDMVRFKRPLAIVTGIILGFFLGLLGQGGAFILIPTMLYALGIPFRVAIGSMLAIGLFSASAGLAGKVATGQVPLYMSLAMLFGAIPFARLGGAVGKKTNTRYLRWILAMLITASTIKIWLDIL